MSSSKQIEETIQSYFTTQDSFNGKRKTILNSISQNDQLIVQNTIVFFIL
jgi:hypothetical protein